MNQGVTLDLSRAIKTVKAAGLMQFVCTIKKPPTVRDAVGRRSADPADWIPLADHIDLVAFASPAIIPRVTASKENKMADWIGEKSELHVILDAFYPLIEQSYRATLSFTVNAVTYTKDFDILGVEGDSQHTYTRMAVQVYQI